MKARCPRTRREKKAPGKDAPGALSREFSALHHVRPESGAGVSGRGLSGVGASNPPPERGVSAGALPGSGIAPTCSFHSGIVFKSSAVLAILNAAAWLSQVNASIG